jgi:hypothetical protein
MAVLFHDSMDAYGANADVATRWDIAGGTYTATGGRYGGKALNLSTQANTKLIPLTGDSSSNKLFVSTSIKWASFSATNFIKTAFVASDFLNAATPAAAEHIAVGMDGAGKALLYRGATIIATAATATFVVGTWYRVELMVVVDATVGSAELKVNEVSVLTFSGNTKGTATAGVQAVSFFGNTGNNFAYDDIMIWNSQGLAPTDFVGDFRIDAYTPTANGSTVNATFVGAGVTVAYQAVDDPALNNADTDYILDDVINDINLFAMADLATTPTSVIGVGIVVAARADNVGTRKIQLGNKSGAVTGWSGTDITLPAQAAYVVRSQFFPLDLATGAAWTGAGVNAIEVGFKVMA